MNTVHVVMLLAVLQYIFFGVLVGQARGRYGVKAPAVTGHESFERIHRVQMNTLEQLAAFLPATAIAAQYWPDGLVAGFGVVYLIGRFAYWRGYVADPARRGTGFVLTVTPTFALIAMALLGAIVR